MNIRIGMARQLDFCSDAKEQERVIRTETWIRMQSRKSDQHMDSTSAIGTRGSH